MPPDRASLDDAEVGWDTWAEVLARFPNAATAYVTAAAALTALGHPRAADKVLTEGQMRYPTDKAVGSEWAKAARERGDRPEVLRRCERLRQCLPDDVFGYYFAVECLRELNRIDEAAEMLRSSYHRFPGHPDLLVQDGYIAHARQLFDEADCIWQRLRAEHDNPAGFIAGVATLRARGSYAEADELARTTIGKYPSEPAAWFQYASVSEASGDWPEAARRWEETRRRFPARAEGYISGARALAELGQVSEAEALLARAIELSPSDRGVVLAHAELAERREDWVSALSRWSQAQKLFPNDLAITPRVYAARMRLVESGSPAVPGAEAELPVGPLDPRYADFLPKHSADGTPLHDVMMRFESLGGTSLGCEFGGIQRAFGAEPLGLLRWTEMSPDQVISALNARFEGVGQPEHTELSLQTHDGRTEYWTRDKRFGMASHTFVAESAMPWDKMFRQSCRRLAYLRNKLIDDLSGGQKIFVYKITWRSLTDDELDQMYGAIQTYGRSALLYVDYANSSHPTGSVEEIRPGLFVGYIERFGISREGTLLSDNRGMAEIIKDWATICAKVLSKWESEHRTPAAACEMRASQGTS